MTINYKQFIQEAKASMIKRMPNLSKEEKDVLMDTFKRNVPKLEQMIDWNKWKKLTFDDFEEVLDSDTFNSLKSKVKEKGIKGLKEGKDVIDVSHMYDGYTAYIPLHFNASKLLGSKYIGKCEGRWCTSSNRPATWRYYTGRGVIIIIAIHDTNNKKYAIATHERLMDVEIYDEDNKEVVVRELVSSTRANKRTLVGYTSKIKEFKYGVPKWLDKAKIRNEEYEVINNVLYWADGEWLDGHWVYGVWEEGLWHKGTWRDGEWNGGNWKKGVWEFGEFNDGVWEDGEWKSGDFKGGTWIKGDWYHGIFWDGVWEGGTWHGGAWVDGEWLGGEWLGGYDQYKNKHPAGDSPDKW